MVVHCCVAGDAVRESGDRGLLTSEDMLIPLSLVTGERYHDLPCLACVW
jgi:hypothetical protein